MSGKVQMGPEAAANRPMAAWQSRAGQRDPARGLAARAEWAFCFFALSMCLGAYSTIPLRLEGIDLRGGESNPYNAAALAVVLAGTMLLIVRNWTDFVRVGRLGTALNLLAGLAILSCLWSFDPAVSLRKSLTLLQMVTLAYYLVARHSVEQLIRLLSGVFGLALVLSLALGLAAPDLGVMHEADLNGDWCGVFVHKSALGEACILATLCFAWRWMHEPERRIVHSAFLLLCFALAWLSMSKLAQLTILLLGPMALCLCLLRLPGVGKLWAGFVMVVLFVSAGAILSATFTELTEAVGKDATLTGRVPVWQSLIGFAARHPLGGYGYNAFFVPGNPDVEAVWRRGGWVMWDAHNSYVGVALELGLPGLALSAWILLAAVWRSIQAFSGGAVPWAGFAATYLLNYGLVSLVEMVLFRGDIHSVMLPMLAVSLVGLRERAPAPLPEPVAGRRRPARMPVGRTPAEWWR